MNTPTDTLQEVESLRAEVQRLQYAISDAVTILQPQAKVMNPSLLAVREAVSILNRQLPWNR